MNRALPYFRQVPTLHQPQAKLSLPVRGNLSQSVLKVTPDVCRFGGHERNKGDFSNGRSTKTRAQLVPGTIAICAWIKLRPCSWTLHLVQIAPGHWHAAVCVRRTRGTETADFKGQESWTIERENAHGSYPGSSAAQLKRNARKRFQ